MKNVLIYSLVNVIALIELNKDKILQETIRDNA